MLKVKSYSSDPSVKFLYWYMSGLYHDVVDLVSWRQVQKCHLCPNIFRYLFSLSVKIGRLLGLVCYFMNTTGICSQV